jgi:hypothetical protein
MNTSRNGSAARASRKRQMGERSAGCRAWRARQAGVPPSSANGMGVGISLSCAPAMALPCGRETTRSRFGVTSDFDALLPAREKHRQETVDNASDRALHAAIVGSRSLRMPASERCGYSP